MIMNGWMRVVMPFKDFLAEREAALGAGSPGFF